MDVTMLSRIQFAAATYFHFLFETLTLGLGPCHLPILQDDDGPGHSPSLLVIAAWLQRKRIESKPFLLRSFLYLIPLPYVLCGRGWTVAEVGR